MPLTAAVIAERIGGTVEGDGSVEVLSLSGLQDAESGDISFLANPKYTGLVTDTRASVVIVSEEWEGECSAVIIRVKDPDAGFAAAAALVLPPPVKYEPGIHASAVIADDAVLGEGVTVGPLCVIESRAKIGAHTVICAGTVMGCESVTGESCFLHPNVTVRDRMIIGDRVIIHSGTVIGSDGFGYSNDGGKWVKIPQVGIVQIGNDVEIGANSTIDRARFGKTIICDGVKIDNQVQIAHNVVIGENTAMAAQVGVAGSARIGRNVQVGGQCGFAGHITVGDGVIVGGGGGVTKSVRPGEYVWGTPAMNMKKYLKLQAHVARLPEMKKKIGELEKKISELETRE